MTEPNIAFVANLLADPSRAAMCLSLAGGEARPAGELAARALRIGRKIGLPSIERQATALLPGAAKQPGDTAHQPARRGTAR